MNPWWLILLIVLGLLLGLYLYYYASLRRGDWRQSVGDNLETFGGAQTRHPRVAVQKHFQPFGIAYPT